MVGTCDSCAAAGPVERHHPTGRLDGDYLDRALTVPLCLRCHAGVHATWEALGLTRWCCPVSGHGDQAIEGTAMAVDRRHRRAGTGPTERTELRLRRLATTLGRLGVSRHGYPAMTRFSVT